MNNNDLGRPIEILLVEDNPADVRLTIETLKDSKIHNNMSIATDGIEAMAFLHKEGKYANAVFPDISGMYYLSSLFLK